MRLSFPMPATVKVDYLDKVTFDVVNQVLMEAYALHRADPGYLFMSGESFAELRRSIEPSVRYPGLEAVFGFVAIINPATGKRIDVIPLPNLDDNQVILGFLED